jgi:hypothetical protein
MSTKRESKHLKDEHLTVDVPLTIDIALQIVAREKKLQVDDLVGGILMTGDIGVSFKGHPGAEDFLVSTLERERRVALVDIVLKLESNDIITDVFFSLDADTIFDILMERADLKDLHPWIISYAREFTREIAFNDHERFWRLCGTVGLRPGVAPRIAEGVVPSFTMIKDLQDALIPTLLADPRAVLVGKEGEAPLFDNDQVAACEILLDQCNFDLEAVASDLLKAMGGVQGCSDDPLTVTSDGYVILGG